MKSKSLSNLELSAFCSQIYMLLNSGMTISYGIDLMLLDNSDESSKEILQTIAKSLDGGNNFSVSLNDCNVFPQYMVDMVKVGEESGNLDIVCESLAVYYQRQYEINIKIKDSVKYPLIMVLMMTIVMFVIIVKVLPIFEQVYLQLGNAIQGENIFKVSRILANNSMFLIFVLIILVVFFLYFNYSNNGKKTAVRIIKRFSYFNKLYEKNVNARLFFALSLMTSSGIKFDESLELAKNLMGDDEIKNKINQSIVLIKEQKTIDKALSDSNLLNKVYAKMLFIGFKTGNSVQVMDKIAAINAQEFYENIDNKISSIEPILVGIFSITVGLILLSVIVPLIGLMSSIGL
ncbi:MAG: type II secretion system F family protein [Erysipelotrichaceae bacterium]